MFICKFFSCTLWMYTLQMTKQKHVAVRGKIEISRMLTYLRCNKDEGLNFPAWFLTLPPISWWERTYFCKLSLSNFTSAQKCNSRDQSVCGFTPIVQLRSSHTDRRYRDYSSSAFCSHEQLKTSEQTTAQTLRSGMPAMFRIRFFSMCQGSLCSDNAWWGRGLVPLRLNFLNSFYKNIL